ncbi:MAG: hypothetical protein WDA07_07560 [Leucobacter sp.]
MNASEHTPKQESADERSARERTERWDREVRESGHAYAPSPATVVRRQAEIARDQEQQDGAASVSDRIEAANVSDLSREADDTSHANKQMKA